MSCRSIYNQLDRANTRRYDAFVMIKRFFSFTFFANRPDAASSEGVRFA